MVTSSTVCLLLVSLLPCNVLAQGLLNLGANTNLPGSISAFPDQGSLLGSGLPKLPSVTDPLKLPEYPAKPKPQPTSPPYYPSQTLYPKDTPLPGYPSQSQYPLQSQYPSVNYGQSVPFQTAPNRYMSNDYKNHRLLRALGFIPGPGKAGGYVPPGTGYVPPNTGYVPPNTGYALPKAGYVPPKTDYALPKAGYVPPNTNYVPPKTDYVPAKSAQPTFPNYDIYSRLDQLYKDRTPGLPYRPSPKHSHGVVDKQKCHPTLSPKCYGYLKVCECKECNHYGCHHFCC